MRDTLILNSDYTPMQIVPWTRAITLYFQGVVHILLPHKNNKGEDLFVGNVSGLKIHKPSIVITTRYVDMSRKRAKLSRDNLLFRDNYTCQYTGKKLESRQLDIDHVIPRCRGGKNSWENMVVCSKQINNYKGDRTPEEAGLKLIAMPRKPHWTGLLLSRIKAEGRQQWIEFLGQGTA